MSGEQRKAVIKNADMDEKLQQDAVDIASKALSEYNIEKVTFLFSFFGLPFFCYCHAMNMPSSHASLLSSSNRYAGRSSIHQERVRS
jgi:hypothetical protein